MPDSKTSLGLEATVSLHEITRETVNSSLDLCVTKEQERFVASNAVSIYKPISQRRHGFAQPMLTRYPSVFYAI